MENIDNKNKKRDFLEWHCKKHENINNCKEECYVNSILSLFGKKYTMPIIRALIVHKKLRFNEIEDIVEGSPKTITKRLRELEEKGLVNREVFNEVPIRVEYTLNECAEGLEDIFERIAIWAKNLANYNK